MDDNFDRCGTRDFITYCMLSTMCLEREKTYMGSQEKFCFSTSSDENKTKTLTIYWTLKSTCQSFRGVRLILFHKQPEFTNAF